MLPPKIAQQKDYMTDALNILRDIDAAERLFKDFDPTYLTVLKENLYENYAEVMSMLFEPTVAQALEGNDYTLLAKSWWNGVDDTSKQSLMQKYYPCSVDELKLSELVNIYLSENSF